MLTDAERWELEARHARVFHARTLLQVAEQEHAQAQARIAQAHGIDVTRPYRFLPDGCVVQDVEEGGAGA